MASPPEDPTDLDAARVRIAELTAQLEASRRAHRQLERLCDSAPDTLVLHDEDGHIRAFNSTAAAAHGYSSEEFARLRIGQLIPHTNEPGDPGDPGQPAWDARTLSGPISLETVHRHREGHSLTFETTVVPLPSDDPLQDQKTDFAVIGHDPSARKRADRERQRVERRFRGIFEAAPLGMISVDARRAILAANGALARMIGVRHPGVLIGRGLESLLVAEDREEAAGRLAALAMGGSDTERFECRLEVHASGRGDPASGQPRAVEISALVDQDAPQGERELLVFFDDISERRRGEEQQQRMFDQLDELVAKRTEELSSANDRLRAEINERRRTEVALQEAKLAAESANRAKSQFLASMSHELRTPLNAIIGYSEMLMEDAEDDGRDDELVDLEKIRGAGRHLLGIINDILDLSKVEAGKVELFYEDVDLARLVKEVMTTIRPLADRGGNELQLELRDHPEVVRTDVTRLRQILFNLLSNACKFTEQGSVSLDINAAGGGGKPQLRFQIRDTGVGMKPEQLEKLFVPFTQADASTTRKFGGTGLGLSISDRFAKMLGGRIEVESTYGEGSTFTVWLPLDADDAPREGRPERSSATMSVAAVKQALAGEDGHPRILVVDDDPEARELLARLLGREGYPVSQAASGAQALEMARADPPGLITLDVLMPGMDGWAVLSRLKETPELASIPVIIVSLVHDRGMAYALGAADFLSKPVERDKLLSAIHRFDHGDPPFTILVVDDEADARDLIRRALQREDWQVRTATSGLEALDAMRADKPDLVVLDLMMPGMDGFEVLEHVRSDPGLRDLPVVVVTAKDLEEQERETLSRRVASVMQKGSYSREHLLESVAREAERVRRRGST